MKFLNRIQTRLILAFLVVVLLPLLGTSFYGNWITSRTLERTALDAAHHNLDQLAVGLSGAFGGLGDDVLFLSRLESLDALLTVRIEDDTLSHGSARARLADDFLAYARTHSLTYQVRYLDETGYEVVRVDCLPDGCRRRPNRLLQNKADRYYFTQTMQLSAGQLYVSPLDLNREFGRIEKPYRPVIRLATPVYHPARDADGRRAGIVVLNVLAEPILAAVYRASHGNERVALADENGYYLAHPDETRLWGGPRDLNTGQGLARDYGDLFAVLVNGSGGMLYYPPQAGWQEVAAQLLPPGPFISKQRALTFRPLALFGDNGPRWILLSDQPRAALFASVAQFRWTAIATLGAATLLALAMTAWFARRLTAPILTLTQGARRIEQGEWEHRIQVTSRDEIGELAVAFNAMAAAQQRHRTQLQTLVKRLISAQEEERRMLAYDLHDGLIQRLVGARLHLRNFVAQEEAPSEPKVALDKGLTQLATAIAEARRMIEGLRPATLDDLGLVAALEQYVQELGAEAGWDVAIEADPDALPPLPATVEITAFRIAQEALTNVRKHADAHRVIVALDAQEDRLVVEIQDSGRGFDPDYVDERGHCIGLISMQERARVLGGKWVIESEPGRGTTVRAVLPLGISNLYGVTENDAD